MKKILLQVFLSFILLASVMVAQTANVTVDLADENHTQQVEKYKIDPRPYLEWGTELSRNARAENPNLIKEARAKRTTNWDYTIGSEDTFWDQSFVDGNWIGVAATCRGIGDNCYVFVENSLWGNRVTQDGVDGIVDGFNNSTIAYPDRGIYDVVTEVFGDPPDIDFDERIIILVLDIDDGWDPEVGGGYIAGYFWAYHENLLDATFDHSNEAEIYFLDANPADLSTPNGIENSLNTAAHEFQHMINWNYNPNQHTFFDEGCSMLAEHICGYDFREQNGWANNTNVKLLAWDEGPHDVLVDYSRAARYMLYYYDQFGSDFITKFVQSEGTGTSGLDDALGRLDNPTSRRWNDINIENNLLVDWFTANTVDDKSIDERWGYDLGGLTKGVPRIHYDPNVIVSADTVLSLGAKYISFVQGSNLTINFAAVSPNFVIRAVKIADGYKVVEDVQRGVDYNVPDFGTTFNTVTFVLINKSQFSFSPFSYTATGDNIGGGTFEIAYDIPLEPSGVLLSTPGDTVAVTFDGVPDMWIKTIKVALRQAGSVTGGLWRYSGVTRPSPLGEELLVPFTATSTIATRPPYPYPTPYNNWVEVDVESNYFDAADDFVVGFVVQGTYESDGSGGNRVMITEYPGEDAFHSYAYLQDGGSGPNWYFQTTGNGSVYIYLIRAVVTDGTVDVELEGEIVPQSFALEQNYPNPFNPSTAIRYQLADHSNVSIKIYDMIGREVATLVNEEKAAGTYEVNWNGRNYSGQKVSSGVYFYTISTKDFVQTKKMVFMK